MQVNDYEECTETVSQSKSADKRQKCNDINLAFNLTCVGIGVFSILSLGTSIAFCCYIIKTRENYIPRELNIQEIENNIEP